MSPTWTRVLLLQGPLTSRMGQMDRQKVKYIKFGDNILVFLDAGLGIQEGISSGGITFSPLSLFVR